MKKLNLYVHERIEVGDNIILETKLETDKAYIAIIYEKDLKKGCGAFFITKELGQLIAYFDEFPTMEDARPYWVIQYFVNHAYERAGEDMKKILDVLLLNKKIEKPVLMHNINEAVFKDGDVIHIQKGKIFPDDPDDI